MEKTQTLETDPAEDWHVSRGATDRAWMREETYI